MPRHISQMELEFLQGRDALCSDWIQMLADSTHPHHPKAHIRKVNYYYTQAFIYTWECLNVPSLSQGRLCRLELCAMDIWCCPNELEGLLLQKNSRFLAQAFLEVMCPNTSPRKRFFFFIFLELREEVIGIRGQVACLQSAWSVLDSLWALASDLLFRLLVSWWFSSPDSLYTVKNSWPWILHHQWFGLQYQWLSCYWKNLWTRRQGPGLTWHFQDLVSRRSTAAVSVSVGSGVESTWWPGSTAGTSGRALVQGLG